MSHVTCQISISLDGFVAGPNQSLDNPIGEGGMRLHEWAFATDTWNEQHGLEGGERTADSRSPRRSMQGIGAYIMGRNMFGAGRGDVGRVLDRLVGRGPAVPHAGLRAHPPRARAARDGGRHDVPLRHRRDRVGARAGARGGRRPRRLDRGRREHGAPVPRGRAARRAVPAHRRRSCSAPASGCSTASATRRSSRSRSSPRRRSRT